MAVYHSREAMIQDIRTYPDKMFEDGVLTDCPKRRRREQATDPNKQVRIQWPADQKKRFAAQYNRFVERCTKEEGIELLLQQLESLTDAEIDMLHADEHDFDDDQIQIEWSQLPQAVGELLHDLAYDVLSRPRFQYRNRARWILRGPR